MFLHENINADKQEALENFLRINVEPDEYMELFYPDIYTDKDNNTYVVYDDTEKKDAALASLVWCLANEKYDSALTDSFMIDNFSASVDEKRLLDLLKEDFPKHYVLDDDEIEDIIENSTLSEKIKAYIQDRLLGKPKEISDIYHQLYEDGLIDEEKLAKIALTEYGEDYFLNDKFGDPIELENGFYANIINGSK